MKQWISPRALRAQGILGMNERNVRYIGRYNARRFFPLVDNKLKTKLLAQDAGVRVPELLGQIRSQHEVSTLRQWLPEHGGFAIKPAKGSGGKGILVITEQSAAGFHKGEQILDLSELQRHVSNILAGLHSLGGAADVALIERLIQRHPAMDRFSVGGVPDIRVILLCGYPVMAMMRLSTEASDGKANLHQGAVGVGLDIATGIPVQAVQFDRPVRRHPDTHADLMSLQVPDWTEMLTLASACYDWSGLGYLGADMVVDAGQGPMLLELNARPGLAIQIGSGTGLRPRLQRVEAHLAATQGQHLDARERTHLAQQWFASRR